MEALYEIRNQAICISHLVLYIGYSHIHKQLLQNKNQ